MDNTFNRDEIWSFNTMIASLYQETAKENAVYNCLRLLKQFCFFEKGDVFLYGIENGKLQYDTFIFTGWGKELSTYMRYRELDDVIPIISTHQSLVFRSSDIFIDFERHNTEYYKKVLEPCSMDYSIEGNLYYEDDKIVCGFCLHRQKEYGDFSEKELDFAKLVKPHLANLVLAMVDSDNISASISNNDPNWHANTMAVWNFGDDYTVHSVDVGDSDFIKKYCKEIESTLQSICSNMDVTESKKNPIGTSELHNNFRITIEDRAYYIEIVYTSENNEPGTYTCMVYDYVLIINNLIKGLKERYKLTDREFEILKYMFEGVSNVEIGNILSISQSTTKTYAASIYRKLGVEGRHQLFLTLK